MKTLLIVLLLVSVPSMAMDFEIGIGKTHFKPSQNGTWYQEAFPYTLDLESVYWSVGASHKFESFPRVRAEYVDLGDASADALAVPIDAYYNTNTNQCLGQCLPLAHFVSSGSVRGVALSIAPEKRFGDFTVFVEGGFYFFRPTYSAIVTNVRWTHDADPITVYTKHKTSTQVTYLIGAGIRYKNVEFLVRHYDVEAADDNVPAVYLGANTASIRVLF